MKKKKKKPLITYIQCRKCPKKTKFIERALSHSYMKSEPPPKCSKSGCVPLPGLRGSLKETERNYVKCCLLLLEVLI